MSIDSKNKRSKTLNIEVATLRPAEKIMPMVEEHSCCDSCAPVKKSAQVKTAAHDHDHSASYIPTLVSLLLLISGIGMDFFQVAWFEGYLKLVWFGIAYLLVGAKVVQYAINGIAKGSIFNEFFLMTLATLGAFYLGEYAEGVAVMLFYVVGEHFQEAAVARSRKSIKDLIDNRPEKVNVIRNGVVAEVKPDTVSIGEYILVKAGEKVALDGEMQSEVASFNTSALTGESRPDTKVKGDTILAGMINLDKAAELKVTATYENSALAKILTLVDQARGRKAHTQQFISRFAKVYTPIVVALATGLTLLPYFFVEQYQFDVWLYRALIFLVISCPCALVVSIPLGYFGGIGAASRNGILFKGANFLDQMRKVDTVVMDKTGTLTEGVFKVQQVHVEKDKKDFLPLVAALESKSGHPIAQAIVDYAGLEYQYLTVTDVEEIAGSGLIGKVGGFEVIAGNTRLMNKFGIAYDPSLNELTETIVAVAIDGQYVGYITIADQLKPDATVAIQALRKLGLSKLVMLSGDNKAIVKQVAATLQLDEAFGGLLPEDKVEKVAVLKKEGRTVAFVGDGINDAPVIALADVGMAMGALGSDAAIETADVVIQTDQPHKVATAIRISQKTHQIVWQNISLAFGVKALVLLLGAGGIATMWEAVFADVGVAFLAILNAIRIQRMNF